MSAEDKCRENNIEVGFDRAAADELRAGTGNYIKATLPVSSCS